MISLFWERVSAWRGLCSKLNDVWRQNASIRLSQRAMDFWSNQRGSVATSYSPDRIEHLIGDPKVMQ
jgi:hypothetical protein